MLKGLFEELESSMQKTVEALRKEFATMRAGRATPSLLDRIKVDYYGVPTPINQLANISVPEPRLLVIQPWDKNSIEAIERAIQKSDLGIPPNSDGNVIRLVVPQLTEERRRELVKVIRKKAEEARVAIRNIRRQGNDRLKEMEKEGEISEDEYHREIERVQELTDRYIKEIDKVLAAKEKDIMEV